MTSKIRTIDDFLALLSGVKQVGKNRWMALCPSHNDRHQSLSITLDNDRILVYCHAGCSLEQILAALKLTKADLFLNDRKPKTPRPEHREIDTIYHYIDAEGKPFEVVRTKPKGFYQRRPDGNGGYINNLRGIVPTLYHQDKLKQVIESNALIYIVEGERDADRLWSLGLAATTNPMGAGKWRDSYADVLHGADLIIIPDNDSPGYDHANHVAKSCYGKVARVRILELLPGSKDISDWLDNGGDAEQLKQLVSQCPTYKPQADTTLDTLLILELPAIAWQGLFKDYRDLVGETTEAADAFHFATFCQVLGCTIGRRLHVYHATKLYPNFYICLVGRSGLTRKDTCWSRAANLLNRLHADYEDSGSPPFRVIRGLRSYEGLLDELSGEHKVRAIYLGELLSLLAKAKQESLSNIIPQLTELYDCPDRVNPPVHQKNTADCREPFVSIMAGTTQAWLHKALTERDIYGGFANRWLFFSGLPKDPNPNPPKMNLDRHDALIEAINTVRCWAEDAPNNGEIQISPEADNLFAEYYRAYYQRCQAEGLIPTLIQRIQDAIWKLALLYAAIDLSDIIKADHIKPAIAVGNYLESSVAGVFHSFAITKGKQAETKILDYLKSVNGRARYTDVYRNLHLSAKEMDSIVVPLIKLGVIKNCWERNKMGRNVRMLEVTEK